MALIKCSECGAQISSTAKLCPKCGAPNIIEIPVSIVETPVVTKESIQQLSVTKKSKSKKKFAIISGVVMLSILVIVFLLLPHGSPKLSEEEIIKRDEARRDSIRLADSIAASKMAMQERMKEDSLSAVNSNKGNRDNNQTSNPTATTSDNGMESVKKNLRNNWYNNILIEHSAYTYERIGGIQDLYIKVTNNTDYVLNDVQTTISYIKTDGDIFKTETVSFSNIQPHSWMQNRAPDSNRGTSVSNPQFTSITSNDLNFCYAPGNWAANSPDPYKCK